MRMDNPARAVLTNPLPACHYCGAPATTRDHVIPKVMGGPTKRWNLVPACQRCNGRKGRRTYEDFTGRAELPPQSKFRTTAEFVVRVEVERARERARRERPVGLTSPYDRGSIVNHPAWVGPVD